MHVEKSNHSEWRQSLTVEMIAEPLTLFGSSDEPSEILELMRRENWSEAGFARGDGKHSVCVLSRSALEKNYESWAEIGFEDFSVEMLVAAQCPIRDAFDRIISEKRLFVLGGSGVDRIVTVADLNKQPVQLMLFGIVSDLEVSLLNWIRPVLSREDASSFLTEDRINKAHNLFEDRRKRDLEIDFSDCLQFGDKADIARKAKIADIGDCFNSKTELKTFFKQAERLRNYLAHSQDPDKGLGWDAIARIIDKADKIISLPLPSGL